MAAGYAQSGKLDAYHHEAGCLARQKLMSGVIKNVSAEQHHIVYLHQLSPE